MTLPAHDESCYLVLTDDGKGRQRAEARLEDRDAALDQAESQSESLRSDRDDPKAPFVQVVRAVTYPQSDFVDHVEVARFPRPRGAYWEKTAQEAAPDLCETPEDLRSEPALALIGRLLEPYLQGAEVSVTELAYHHDQAMRALDTGNFVQDAVKKAALLLPIPDMAAPAKVKWVYEIVQRLLDQLAGEVRADHLAPLAPGRFRRAMAKIEERYPDNPGTQTRLALTAVSRHLAECTTGVQRLAALEGLARGALRASDRIILDRFLAGLLPLTAVIQAFAPGPTAESPVSRYAQAVVILSLHEGRMPEVPGNAAADAEQPDIRCLLTAVEDGYMPRTRAALRAALVRLLDRRGSLLSNTDPRVELGAVNDLLTIALGGRGLLSIDRPLLDRLRERSTRQLGPDQVRELIKQERPGIDRARALLDLIPKMPGTGNRAKLAEYLADTITPDALARGMPRDSTRLSWIRPIASLLADLKQVGIDPFTLRQIEQRVDKLLYEIIAEDLIRGVPEPGRRLSQVLRLVAGGPLPAGQARDALVEQLAATVKSRAMLDQIVSRFPDGLRDQIRNRITDLLGDRAPA